MPFFSRKGAWSLSCDVKVQTTLRSSTISIGSLETSNWSARDVGNVYGLTSWMPSDTRTRLRWRKSRVIADGREPVQRNLGLATQTTKDRGGGIGQVSLEGNAVHCGLEPVYQAVQRKKRLGMRRTLVSLSTRLSFDSDCHRFKTNRYQKSLAGPYPNPSPCKNQRSSRMAVCTTPLRMTRSSSYLQAKEKEIYELPNTLRSLTWLAVCST